MLNRMNVFIKIFLAFLEHGSLMFDGNLGAKPPAPWKIFENYKT